MEEEHPIRFRQEIKSKMSTLVFHLLFNHSRTSTKKMDSNMLCWDVQCVSKFGYIILLEIRKETTNGWVNILGIERVWDVLIMIASVSFCRKPLISVPYTHTFGLPDQGQMLDVRESQTAESALRDDWTWNVPHHTLEVVLEVILKHMCTGLRPWHL